MIDRLFGNHSSLPFPLILSARSQLLQRRASSLLAVFALAAGVALAASVEMATRSVSSVLSRTADALVGAAELEITAGESGVPESLLEEIRQVPGVMAASPLIQRTFRLEAERNEASAVRVLGIDLLYEREVRSYDVSSGGLTVGDPMRLLASDDALLVAERLARQLGLEEGNRLRLRGVQGAQEFVVRGTLHGDLADAFGGQVAIADVFALQHRVGQRGRVDRIDVAVDGDADRGALARRLEEIAGPGISVRRSTVRQIYVDAVMGALSSTVWTLALVAMLLSLALVYAVTSQGVERRTEEIALLRAAGLEASGVSRMLLLDGLVLAAAGTSVGLAGAAVGAEVLVEAFSQASDYLQEVSLPPVAMARSTVAAALLAGIPVAVLATLGPALRASRQRPAEVLAGRNRPLSELRPNPLALALGSAAAIGCVLASSGIPSGLPTLRVAGCLVLGITAMGVLGTQLLLLLARPLQAALGWVSPRVGYLAAASMVERPVETGSTMAIWAGISGALLAVATMIQSMVVSIDDYWFGITGEEVVMVFAQDPLESRHRELISRDAIAAMDATPGVLATAPFYNIAVVYQGEEVAVESFAAEALARFSGGARSLSQQADRSLAALRRGEALMSQAFARRFAVEVGDSIEILTDRGPARFRIGGFGRSYAGSAGAILLDLPTYLAWYDTPGAQQVAIWTADDRETVLTALQRRVPDQPLFFRHGDAFRRHTALVVGKFNALLMIPVFLMGAIGVVSLFNTLIGNIVARTRTHTILRACGATARDLRLLSVATGVALGSLGLLGGVALSVPWARVLTLATADGLGYAVEMHAHPGATALVVSGGLLLALVSAVLPGRALEASVPRGAAQIG